MCPSSDGAAAEVTVVLATDLHARPAGQLVRAAAGFRSSIRLVHRDRTVDAASVLGVMSLGATAGTSVTVRAQGPDAPEACRTLAEMLRRAGQEEVRS